MEVKLEKIVDIKTAQHHYEQLYNHNPEKYATKIDTNTATEQAHILPDDDEQLYFIKKDNNNIIGYVLASITPPGGETPQTPGYQDYTHQGDSLTINKLEVFETGKGIGSKAIKLLQEKQDIELIDLEAKGEQLKKFYTKNGFTNTTLTRGAHTFYAWHNPHYSNNKRA